MTLATGAGGRGRVPLAGGERPRRILAIRRKALGDVLVTLPAVAELARAFPGARIDLVVDRPYVDLVACLAPELTLLCWPPSAGLGPDATGGAEGWVRRLRAGRYDLAIDFLGTPRTALWTALSGARCRVGYDLRLRSWAYNLVVPRNRDGTTRLRAFAGEAFLDPLRALGLAPAPWRPASGKAPALATLGARYQQWHAGWSSGPRPRIGLVLSASWSAKAWPAAQAAALCRLAAAAGAAPLMIPGPADEPIAAALRVAAPEVTLAPPTDLRELAHLLGCLDLLIATDCGARHLAALLGTPTATLFGPTDPAGWNPADPRHVAIRTGEPCSPCDLTVCPVPGHPCLDGLPAAQVWTAARALLARAGS